MATTPSYSPAFAALLTEERLNPLDSGEPNTAVHARLRHLRIEDAFAPRPVRNRAMATACLAGTWLYHNYWEEAHTISQELDTAEGSYWHGLVHRREPDFSNAAYWFRRVGGHPIFEPLRDAAAALVGPDTPPEAAFLARQPCWDPFAFLGLCEASLAGRSPGEPLCRRVQLVEWKLLFEFCYVRAIES